MEPIEKVYSLLNERNGYMTSETARKSGVHSMTLHRMAERGLIERVAHGLYIGADIFPDPFFITQYRCPQGVFSNETALFLHGLSDRNPLRLMMTIPSGWNTPLLTDENIRFFYSKPSKMRLGVYEVKTPAGMPVKAYDIERTLCDCLRNIDTLVRDLILVGLKRYVKSAGRDNAKLLEYTSTLKIRDVVSRYLEYWHEVRERHAVEGLDQKQSQRDGRTRERASVKLHDGTLPRKAVALTLPRKPDSQRRLFDRGDDRR